MDMVCEHLNLLEKDYFGLTFADTDTQKVSELCATITSWEVSGHKHVAHKTNLYSSRLLAGSTLSGVHYP